MILNVLSFLIGICSLQLFSELPAFNASMSILISILLFIILLKKILLVIQKNIDSWLEQGKLPFSENAIWNVIKFNKSFLKPITSAITKHVPWLLLVFILGYLWMWLHIYLNLSKRLPENLVGEPIRIVGTIVSLPETQGVVTRFEFQVKNTLPAALWNNPGRVLLSYYEPKKYGSHGETLRKNIAKTHKKSIDVEPLSESKFTAKQLQVGNEWQFWVKLKNPRGYSNPGSFDKEKYYFQNRLLAEGRVLLKLPATKRNKNSGDNTINVGNIKSRSNAINGGSTDKGRNQIIPNMQNSEDYSPKKLSSHWTSFPIQQLRSLAFQKMKNMLENKSFRPIITALVVGLREGITQGQWAVFRDTGTAHLMAISGLHVGLVASLVYFIVQFVWCYLPQSCLIIPASWIAALVAIFAAGIYAIFAGFSIPTQRALVMILLFMSGMLTRRLSNVWRNYFIALAIILIWDPFSTLSLGFWLSFAAVGIMIFGLKNRLYPKGFWWKYGRAQWVVFLGLMPLTLASFNQFSLVSPLANMLAIPWVSLVVVPSALFGSLMLFFSEPVARFLLAFSETSFSLLWPILNFFANLPKATWGSAEISKISFILALIGTILALVPRGFPGRTLGLIALLPLFLTKPISPAVGNAKFTLLDVGQGLSAVLQTNKHVLVFDTGAKFGPELDTGSRVVLPFLESQGIRKIDSLIISHGDNDHIGGLASILKRIPVGVILSSEVQAVEKIVQDVIGNSSVYSKPNLKPCYAGQHWHWEGIDFEMIHPETLHTAKRNDHCCVLQVRSGAQSILLTGDIEMSAEKKIIEQIGQKIASTLLIVPHHGSKTSSTEVFIEAVNPHFALIPVGYLNRYGHPKAEVVARYHQRNIVLLDSVHDGAISFILKNDKNLDLPKSYRKQHKHYWQWQFR